MTFTISAAIHPSVSATSVNGAQVSDGGRLRLLLVSDAPERLHKLASLLGFGGVEMTAAASAEEASQSCGDAHDLAIIDVAPAALTAVLKALRESEAHATIPVLVEASRLADDHTLAGVLPAYRAMPCSLAELVKLTRSCLIRERLRRNAELRRVEQTLL